MSDAMAEALLGQPEAGQQVCPFRGTPVNARQPSYRVDQDFFSALAPMAEVGHVSDCDIAWFVVGYEESGPAATLAPVAVHLTTLEEAVEGLTAGIPVSLETFEDRIRATLTRAT